MRNAAEQSMPSVTAEVLRNLRFVMIVTLVGALLFLGLSFILPQVYRSECRLVPSSRLQNSGGLNLPGALRGASGLMGISLGTPDGDLSQLLAQMVRDGAFTQRILDRTYATESGDSLTLAEYLENGFDGKTSSYVRLSREFHRKNLKIGISERTGVTSLAVELKDPTLARAVVESCVELLDATHREYLNEQSAQMADFLDGRLNLASEELRRAESELEEFHLRNRVVTGSPQLEFEQSRLMRAIQLKNEVYVSLTGQLEMARLEMFRNMPTIVVLRHAVVPDKPAKPNRPLLVLLGLLLSLAVAVLLVLMDEGRRRWRQAVGERHV